MSSAAKRVHPACLPVEELTGQCDVRRLRRSGPGGQHRNKVETAVVLTHRPTGVSAEANERRRQSENHTRAVFRLRVQLALDIRLPQSKAADLPAPTPLWQSRCVKGRISMRADHTDFPALLSEALDQLAIADFDIKTVAEHLGSTSSQLVKFLKLEPRALLQVNAERETRGLHALK